MLLASLTVETGINKKITLLEICLYQGQCPSPETWVKCGHNKQAGVATVREKPGNFLKSQGKSLILSKSVKCQGI